jgi:PmbA protein
MPGRREKINEPKGNILKIDTTDAQWRRIQAILEKARKQSQTAEVFLALSEETPVHLEANRIKSIRSRESSMVALRIFRNGRIGYSTSNDPDNADSIVSDAIETSAFGAAASFELPSPASYTTPDIYDDSVNSVSLDAMLAQAQGMASELTAHTPGLVCDGGAGKETASIFIANSNGLSEYFSKTEYSIGISGVLTRGTDMLFAGDEASSCRVISDTSQVVHSVIEQIDHATATSKISSGKRPVIFTPIGFASALVAPLMAGFNGKLVMERASPLADNIGLKLMDDKFSLYDDTLLPYRPTSRPFDDEGVPSKRLPLIENGVIKSFYYDLRTAALAGTRSTGHGQRSRGQPSPSPGAFVVSAGDIGFDNLVSDIKEGLVIEQLMGATQGNVLGGDFSGNVLLGYKVENGRITGRVKDAVVFGNVYSLLKEISAVGSDGRWVGGVFAPSIYFPAISVASKS